jgi:hypothetical protein
MSLVDTALKLDRRWVFLMVAIAVAVPLFLNIQEKIPITPEVRGIQDALEKLPPGSKVLLACDYDPGTAAEIQPMTVAFLKYAFTHHLKVIIMGLWPQGPQQADLALAEVLADPEVKAEAPKYGVDYINLGFQSGNEVVIQRMGSDIPSVFPQDYRGQPISKFPIMDGVRNFNSIGFVFNMSAGYPGTVEWVQFAGDRFHAKIGSGSTAVQAPQIYPYFPRQLAGLLGGMKGAAEYEELTGFAGKGERFMLSQSSAHMVVVLFVVVGNVAFFISRRRKKTGLEGVSA